MIRLSHIAGKESQTVEFKLYWQDEYLKTLCAFANTDGGELLLGVSDDGKIKGLKNVDHLLETLPNKIRNNLNVVAPVKAELVDGVEIIKIEVSPAEVPVSYKGKFYIRSGSTTQEVNGAELMKFLMSKQKLSWDALLSDAEINETDEETIFRFINMAGERLAISETDSIENILKNLELLKDGKLTNAGLLLFGRNPNGYILNATARVGRFKSETNIIDTIEIKGNLFNQVDGIVEAIKKHINVRFEIDGIERRDVWDYPLPAIREACINALIHRDYLDLAEIQIKIYDNRIWFWNPGRLPEGVTVDMLKREHFSKPRNRLIAMVFYYAGLIERWGTGTKRMVELCKKRGLPEPEFEEFGNGFSVVFYKNIYDKKHLIDLGLNERQIRIVLYAKEYKEVTISTLKKIIPDVSEKTLYRDLMELVDKGFLKEYGTKRGRRYVALSDIYRT